MLLAALLSLYSLALRFFDLLECERTSCSIFSRGRPNELHWPFPFDVEFGFHLDEDVEVFPKVVPPLDQVAAMAVDPAGQMGPYRFAAVQHVGRSS